MQTIKFLAAIEAIVPITTDDADILPVAAWEDVEIDVTLDSGCCEHVMDSSEAPGYLIGESPGSKRGQNFVVGNGQKVPNEGQMVLNLETILGGKRKDIRSTFQIAEVTRPLMSVSRICEHGFQCIFTKTEATIKDDQNNTVAVFQKQGGLYVTKMKLKAPMPDPFGRPER